MVNGSELQKLAFMCVQKLGKKLMSDQSDRLREAQSDKLCALLDVKVDCYTHNGVIVQDSMSDTEAIRLPEWVVKRIVRLRPALQELSAQDQYENQLIHNRYLDMIYDPKN
jgi:hypothetical protein